MGWGVERKADKDDDVLPGIVEVAASWADNVYAERVVIAVIAASKPDDVYVGTVVVAEIRAVDA